MKILEDTTLAAMAKIIAAMLPLISIGLLGEKTVLYVAILIGVACSVVLILRFLFLLFKKSRIKTDRLLMGCIEEVLSFPYAMALSSIILIWQGIDASSGVWLAGFMAVGIMAGYIATLHRDKANNSQGKNNKSII